MSQSKERVLERLVSFLAGYIRLDEARVATLGGEGLEAEVWKRTGIKTDNEHGWLIDFDRQRMRKLFRSQRAFSDLQIFLRDFPRAFRARLGRDAGLDLFHLDLCGTVEPATKDLLGILPLLLSGTARCLGITVADCRRNRSLDERRLTTMLCALVFGTAWKRLWQHLLDMHAQDRACRQTDADPEDVALREAALWAHLLLALSGIERHNEGFIARQKGFPLSQFLRYRKHQNKALLKRIREGHIEILPDRIERFVFGSGSRGDFRMRSYFTHLIDFHPMPINEAAKLLAATIIESPFGFVEPTGSVLSIVVRPEPTNPEVTRTSAEETSAMTNVRMRTVREIREELLPCLINFLGVTKFEHAAAELGYIFELAGTKEVETSSVRLISSSDGEIVIGVRLPNGAQAPASDAKDPAPGHATRSRRARKGGDDYSIEVKDEIRMRIKRARRDDRLAIAAGKKAKAYDTVKKKLWDEFGLKGHALGAIEGNAVGKLASFFIARQLIKGDKAGAYDNTLAELADLYEQAAEELTDIAKDTQIWKQYFEAKNAKPA